MSKAINSIALLLGFYITSTALAQEEILIGYIGDTKSEARRGVELGLQESNIQGKFLGHSFRILDNPTPLQIRVLGNLKAVVSKKDASELRIFATQSAEIPIFNVSERSEALREECHENLLHIITSEAMLDDAISQWSRGRINNSVKAIGWHHSLRKYAASQLNSRYQQKFNEPMSELAWAGWASIKIISDTIARSANSDRLLSTIKNDLKFDGQKGVSMSFRENGQLRQPVLITQNDEVIGEIPPPGPNTKNQLDSLGTTDCYK